MPEPDVNSAIDYSLARRRSTIGQSVLDANEDPDRAARAVDLGHATGVPPVIINRDLDSFEQQHKAGAIKAILDQNPELREWAAKNPMASKIASDDWGQLAKVAAKAREIPYDVEIGPRQPDLAQPLVEATRGLVEGTAEALAVSEPSLTKEYEEAPPYLRTLLYPARAKMDLFTALLHGAARGIHHGSAALAVQFGASAETAQRFGKGMAELGEYKASEMASHGVVVSDPMAFAYRLKLTQERIKPWTDQGKLPPTGIDHYADLALAEKAKHDMVGIDELLDHAEKSLAIERAPGTVDELLRPILKDKISAVPFEAVQKLYGNKLPTVDDGKLGMIPGFAEKYQEAARIGGGDIQVPLADWILSVPAKIRNELRKDFKPNPDGMSLNDAAKVEGLKIEEVAGEEPPIAPDTVRMYHGGQLPIGQESGGLWFTSHRPKAEGYAGAGGEVSYVDLPHTHPLVDTGIPGQGVKEGFTVERELPEEIARTRQLLRVPTKLEDTLRQHAGLDQTNSLTPVLLGGEPPLKEGMTRLYRGHTELPTEKPIPEYVKESPEYRATLEATGRWFTADRSIAEYYNQTFGDKSGRVSYVDVLASEADKYLAAKHPEASKFVAAGREKEEHFLPKDIAKQARELGLVSEAPLFGKMAIGLLKKDYDRFIKAVERQSEAEKAWELKKATEEIQKRRTKQWREESAAIRPDITFEIASRPEWVAHDWFNGGGLRGVSGERPKIDPKYLTREQKRSIPKAYLEKGGSAPDDLARISGFKTGDEMLDVMSRFYNDKGETPPTEYLRRLVDQEVNNAMEAKYGKLRETILAEAQDHVTGITQLERLHETTIALAIKAGQIPTFTKESMKNAVKTEIDRRVIGEQKREYYLKEAGDAGRKMIQAFLKQDWNEAFRQSQRQYVATYLSNEVGKLLDKKAKFEKLAKKFSKVADPESFKGPTSGVYVPYIQEALSGVGRRVGRTPEQIRDAIAQGGYGTLEQFAQIKKGELRDIEIPEFMLGNKPLPALEKLTGEQFKDFHDMIIALDKHGRDESTVYKEDRAHDFDAIRETMVEKLKELGDVKINIHKQPGIYTKLWKTYYPGSLTIESILNRWDKDDAMGVFNQFIVRPLTEASNHEARMIRYYQEALLKASGEMPGMHKMVENSLWLDPYTGLPLELSKRNVLGMLMYWGNPSSRKKLLEGYKVDEGEALPWLLQRTTKEDWDRAQNVGRIFNRLIGLADDMSMKINGVPIKKIEITPFEIQHGKYEGWYNPVEYEPLFPGRTPKDIADQLKQAETMKLKGERLLEQPGYYRANTSQAYTKARTEYVAPTAMDMDIIPARMKQMIHDISFRPAILQAGKFFYDPKWRTAVNHHYGKEYQDLFIPFLHDIANSANQGRGPADTLISHFTQNIIATMIGFNPHTVAKHGMTAGFNSLTEVGPVNFAKALGSLLRTNDVTATTNYRFAMDRSEELQRRVRNIAQYTLGQPELSLQKMGFRETMMHLGSKPVAFSDLLSSVPTWLAQFETAKREGKPEAQAVFEADRAVRRAHGSTSITNLPAIMRTNALGRTFSSLYGFFSHMMQKQFELAWKAKDSWAGLKAGDLSVARQHAPQLIMGFVSYIIIPAVVEEMVTPYTGHEKDSWGKWAVKTMTAGTLAAYVGPKDFVRSMINGTEAAAGMTAAFSKEGLKLIRDLQKGKYDKYTAGNIIRDTFIMAGLLKGWTNAQEGKVLQFFQRYMYNVDHPRDPWDWMHGLTTGTLEKPGHRRH
jgi:hypothetical protein